MRDLLCAVLFALWCVAWPAGLVWILDSAPLFLARLGDAVPRKVIEFHSPLPYRSTLCAFTAIAFAGMWLLLRLRRWLDPQAQAVQALRWTFSSRSLNATVLFTMLAAIGVYVVGMSSESLARLLPLPMFADAGRFFVAWWFPILLSVSMAIHIPAIFFLFNPDTLARERLERWWRPFWPGMPSLVVVVVGWLLVPAVMAQAEAPMFFVIPAADGMPAGAIDIIGYAVELLCDLLVFAFLFSRRTVTGLRDAWRRLFRWPTVRAHVGLDVLLLGGMLVVAAPLLSIAVFDAYVLPSFDAWRYDGGTGVPFWLAALADGLGALHGFDFDALALLLLPSGLWLQFVLARLLYRTAFVVPAVGSDAPAR